MYELIIKICIEFQTIIGDMSWYLLLGFLVAGILSVLISPETVEKHLGKKSISSTVKASLFGIPLPLCSCGVIPVSASLKKHGASNGATTSFLISTPQTGVDSIMATFSLLGPVFAFFRIISAFISGVIGGIMVDTISENNETNKNNNNSISNSSCCSKSPKKKNILVEIFNYGFVNLPADIGKSLIIGLILSALISALIPDNYFANILGGNKFLSMIIMLIIGIPVYVCSTSSIPVAASLILKGISPGAALVFLMTGPATNAASITTILKLMGKKVVSIYLLSVALTSLASGFLFDIFYSDISLNFIKQNHNMNTSIYFHNIGSILLITVIIYSYIKSNKSEKTIKNIDMSIKIDGMKCSHCAKSIKRSLLNISGITNVNIELKNGIATILGNNLNKELIIKKIENLGYKAMEK